MTKKGAKFYWRIECQNAFNDIKQALCQAPVMAYFDPKRETKLIVDGSKKDGLSSILTQRDPKTKQYQVVRYDSRSTPLQEQRYSQMEIESAAIEFGVKKKTIST